MRTCERCGRQLNCMNKRNVCQRCRETCKCGGRKDKNAEQCHSCGKKQTQEKRSYANLSWDSDWFYNRKAKRYAAEYWTDGKKRFVLCSRWNWIKNFGEIPSNRIVHHINGDSTDDRIQNLELLTRRQHAKVHKDRRKTILK